MFSDYYSLFHHTFWLHSGYGCRTNTFMKKNNKKSIVCFSKKKSPNKVHVPRYNIGPPAKRHSNAVSPAGR